jgi:hypothetical protein
MFRALVMRKIPKEVFVMQRKRWISWVFVLVLVFSLVAGGCGGGGGRKSVDIPNIPIPDIPIPLLPVEEESLMVTPLVLFLKVGETASIMAYNITGTLGWIAQNESVAVYPTDSMAARVVAVAVGETDVLAFDSSGAEATCHVRVTD